MKRISHAAPRNSGTGGGDSASALCDDILDTGPARLSDPPVSSPDDGSCPEEILQIMQRHAGVDFSRYRRAAPQRGIARRMALGRFATVAAFAAHLRADAGARDALLAEVLIGTSCFFRNPRAFERLQREILPSLLGRPDPAPVRVWVPGCAAGQEPYSLAMSFLEAAGASARPRRVLIFATEVNAALLDEARTGLYPKNITREVSGERLARFFVEEPGGYRVSRELRRAVVFARQNILDAPPFSRLDLVSCRNLLSHLDAGAQQRVVTMLHDVLNPDGWLWLGANESAAGGTELFHPVDRRLRLYAPAPAAARGRVRGAELTRARELVRAVQRENDTVNLELQASNEEVTSANDELRRINQLLESAHREVVQASRAKDEFLATLSHELRTPLTPILLLASEAADNPELAPHVRADFATISTSIALEARLIDDLLDLTRVASGKLHLEMQACDVQAVLRDAIAVVASDLEAKHIQLVLSLEATSAAVRGDPVRLQQIFWNILRNAVHFTPENGRISVETRSDDAARTISVVISDTGIGIEPEDLDRIFAAFAQGDVVPGAPRRSGGLGLGLAISRTLVELHAGSIQASSPGRGRGSTFVVRLPVLQRSGPVPEPMSLPSPGSNGSAPPIVTQAGDAVRGCVLIVEDHAPTRRLLQRLLERRNFAVLTAGSLAEARAEAGQFLIDLLISDIGLPDGDGVELMAELRSARPRILGIALSGHGTTADIARSQAAGFAEHLVKPVTVAMLDRALARIDSAVPDLRE